MLMDAAQPSTVTWAAGVSAISAIITPLVLAGIGYMISRSLKRIEARQWRSQGLITARLAYYDDIVVPLNDLMCFFTFIGRWKELAPPDIVAIKRALDRRFYTAVPLFSKESEDAYEAFMKCCFEHYGGWGADAKLRTGYGRRKGNTGPWKDEWDAMFTLAPGEAITEEQLLNIRDLYDRIVAQLVKDIQLTVPRDRYSSETVVLNAH